MPTKRVCVPLAAGFEEIEVVAPVDILRRAGASVTLAAIGDDLHVAGRSGITLKADISFLTLFSANYDMLVIPGGPAVQTLRQNQRMGVIVRDFESTKKPIGAICAAPLILHDSGLLLRKRYTAHSSTKAELPDALYREKVVRDGKIITSRGAGTAIDFGLELVRVLYDEATANEIAQAIMV
ncbi:MAG: DJ-1/PfpI family protein [Puniceicoccales bacterium]|jgi:4-methyl-5(b-hydroxyethyl)-thiazole monophosphate biosynthesis|nr:DJ-1/PfpI family protein [Puniceicoccales bacterium]